MFVSVESELGTLPVNALEPRSLHHPKRTRPAPPILYCAEPTEALTYCTQPLDLPCSPLNTYYFHRPQDAPTCDLDCGRALGAKPTVRSAHGRTRKRTAREGS